MKKISVIGLGKLGLPLASTIASKGFNVIGVDINKQIVNDLNKGKTLLSEPSLLKLVKKYKKNIVATTEIEQAIINSEITFIITPTPSQKNGYFSLKYVVPVIEEIAKVFKTKNSYHLVVVVSTIMPGSMNQIKKIIEEGSSKKCSRDFGLCYNPEFIALGSVIYNLLNPDFILIGESDKKAGDVLEAFYKKYLDNKAKFARMSFVNAELAKISVNTFITTKISYANMLAEICEKLPGGDVDSITSALGMDSRIGNKYLRGGASFGGPCFPRDNIAFISLARKLKTTYDISLATHKTNQKQIKRLFEKVEKFLGDKKTIGILGISYKPHTDVIEESAGLHLIKMLVKKNNKINLHDPLSLENAKKTFGEKINYFKNLKECINKSDVLVITTNWPEYSKIKKEWFISNKGKVVIDPWRMIDMTKLPNSVTYLPLGLSI